MTPAAVPVALACALATALAAPATAQRVAQARTEGTPPTAITVDIVLGRPAVPVTPETIEAVVYEGGDLPAGASPLTVRVQILLDRAGISPGIVDGRRGGMSESAVRAFEAREGLPVDGILDEAVWTALGGPDGGPVLALYTVGPDDAEGLTPDLPDDYAEMAAMPAMGYERLSERLAERFHMDEDFLVALNPGAAFEPGVEVVVASVGEPLEVEVERIEVRKAEARLAAFDAAGTMVANYPVTVGSEDTPSPEGVMEVVAVAFEPTYLYDPKVNFQQGDNDEVLTIPAGPNGPVGAIWIDLSKPTYGLHGTPHPDSLFEAQSHGCVRLTNWDAQELGGMVHEGTVVEFVE